MTQCENQQRKANHFCVSLTEINKQTVLAVLVLHQEEPQVSLVLFAPLGRRTLTAVDPTVVRPSTLKCAQDWLKNCANKPA